MTQLSLLSFARAAAKSAALAVALVAMAAPLPSLAQVSIGVAIETAPPALPYYAQPPAPEANYIWQPGYWAWGQAGYYWVPGTWVLAPAVGMYWTPGYWGYDNGSYMWNNGYWGPQVGYYGGINYGFGYNGVGYVGGQWNGPVFAYNTYVTNVNREVIHTTYVRRVVVRTTTETRPSFNGPGGVHHVATPDELAASRTHSYDATQAQVRHAQVAAQSRNQYETVNHGHPSDTAVARPVETEHAMPHYAPVTDADRAAAPKSKPPH